MSIEDGDPRARLRGLLLVAAAACFWSLGGLLIRFVEADAWALSFWRGLFLAAALLLIVAIRHRGATPRAFAQIGWGGLLVAVPIALAFVLFVVAVKLTTVANALLLMGTAPVFAAVLGRVFLGERVGRRFLAVAAVVLAGMAIMLGDSLGGGTLPGDLVALAVAVCFGAQAVALRAHREIDMAPAICLAGLLASALALPVALLVGSEPFAVGRRDLALIALMGFVQIGMGFLCFTIGARLIPAAEATLVALLESVLGPLWVWLVLAEAPGALALAGGGVILAALAVNAVLAARPEAPASDGGGGEARSLA